MWELGLGVRFWLVGNVYLFIIFRICLDVIRCFVLTEGRGAGDSVFVLPVIIKISGNNSYIYKESNTQGRRPDVPFPRLGVSYLSDNSCSISGHALIVVRLIRIRLQNPFRYLHIYNMINPLYKIAVGMYGWKSITAISTIAPNLLKFYAHFFQ